LSKERNNINGNSKKLKFLKEEISCSKSVYTEKAKYKIPAKRIINKNFFLMNSTI